MSSKFKELGGQNLLTAPELQVFVQMKAEHLLSIHIQIIL